MKELMQKSQTNVAFENTEKRKSANSDLDTSNLLLDYLRDESIIR